MVVLKIFTRIRKITTSKLNRPETASGGIKKLAWLRRKMKYSQSWVFNLNQT